jgi:uncharacterized membrane protein YdjX (TVP38/TMEM64 family)
MGRRGARILATSGLAIGAAAGLWFHLESGIEWSVETFREDLAALGAIGPLLFVAAVALRPFLLLPSWVFLVAGGILFGTLWGTLWASLGTVAGALWVYGVARGLAREAVERRLSGAIERVDRYMGRHGAVWLVAYTLMPATPIVGAVPRCALYTFAAASFVSGDQTRMVVASALLGGALLAGWLGRRLWLRAGSDAGRA